jgi:hypothetical protein
MKRSEQVTSLPQLRDDLAHWLDECVEAGSIVEPSENVDALCEVWTGSVQFAIAQQLARSLRLAAQAQQVPQYHARERLVQLCANENLSAALAQSDIVWELFLDIYGLSALRTQLAPLILKRTSLTFTIETAEDQVDDVLRCTRELLQFDTQSREATATSRWILIEFYRCAPLRSRARVLAKSSPELIEVASRICESGADTGECLAAFDAFEAAHLQSPASGQGQAIDPRGRVIHPLHWVFLAIFVGLSIFQLFFR